MARSSARPPKNTARPDAAIFGTLDPARLPAHERARRAEFFPRAQSILGWTAADLIAAMSGEPLQSVRVNRRHPADPAETLALLTALGADPRPIPWAPDSFEIHGDKAALAASSLFAEGRIAIQNASSLIPPLVLAPAPGERVLDLCAAPGGKTSHLAALAGGPLTLVANDLSAQRLPILKETLERLHVPDVRITDHPAQFADRHFDEPFDRILLDAQCSGEGLLDLSKPTALRYWSMDRITKYHQLQKKMLMTAFGLLRPGGTLVYATCTLAPEENEAPLDHLLRHRDGAGLLPLPLDMPEAVPALTRWQDRLFHSDLGLARRIPPQPWREAFFVALIEKKR